MQTDHRLIWISILLLLALLVSAVLNVYFIKRSRHYFREFSLVRLDPLGLAQIDTSADESLAASPEKRVIFLGDSRAANWPAPENQPGFLFINRGVNGHTAVQTNQRYAIHVAPLRPDVVVIQVGINDLHAIAVLAANKAEIINNCEENIQQLVAQARQTGASVIVTTIVPTQIPTWGDRLVWSDKIETAVQTVNLFIRSLPEEQVTVLDAYALLTDEHGRLAQSYATDYLHLNKNGYDVLNKALVQLLNQSQ